VGREIRLNLVLILALVLLPLAGAGSEGGMRVVPAQEILDKIEKGLPVEYDHVIIKGDLDLSKLDLPKRRVERTFFEIETLGLLENATIVSSFIGLNDFIIDGNMYFNNTIFNNSANFWNPKFNGDAYFGGSKFNGTAGFWGSEFNGYTYFGYSKFNGDAGFWGSEFNGYAYFGDSEFNGYAYFGDSKFNGDAGFGSSKFNDTANFNISTFNNSDFSEVQFSKTVSFDDARFSNSTSFNGSRFMNDALFEGAVFDGTLYLTRAKYDRLYIRWKNISELGYDDAAYITLLENFKKLGYLEDYDGCYYEYRVAHRGQDWGGKYHAMMSPSEEWIRKHILDVTLDDFYGYGKKRSWRSEPRALLDALIFSATLFLSGTRLFVDPPQMPQMQRLSPSWARAAFTIERVLGAFFSILFFLAISGTVVR
jgi:hypothetical protein